MAGRDQSFEAVCWTGLMGLFKTKKGALVENAPFFLSAKKLTWPEDRRYEFLP